jgi:hypothetical protein
MELLACYCTARPRRSWISWWVFHSLGVSTLGSLSRSIVVAATFLLVQGETWRCVAAINQATTALCRRSVLSPHRLARSPRPLIVLLAFLPRGAAHFARGLSLTTAPRKLIELRQGGHHGAFHDARKVLAWAPHVGEVISCGIGGKAFLTRGTTFLARRGHESIL